MSIRERQWFDLVHLALQTDSTRVISLNLHSHAAVSIDGQQIGHHEASHHGKKESNIQRLATIEEAEMKPLGYHNPRCNQIPCPIEFTANQEDR